MSLLIHLPLQGNFNNLGTYTLPNSFTTHGTIEWGSSDTYGFESYFKGTDASYAYTDLGNFSWPSNITVCCWIKPAKNGSAINTFGICGLVKRGSYYSHMMLLQQLYPGYMFYTDYYYNTWWDVIKYASMEFPSPFIYNKWVHIAMTLEQSEPDGLGQYDVIRQLYINGIKLDTRTSETVRDGQVSGIDEAFWLEVGLASTNDATLPDRGLRTNWGLCDLRVYNTILNQNEIKEIINLKKNPAEDNSLILNWKLDKYYPQYNNAFPKIIDSSKQNAKIRTNTGLEQFITDTNGAYWNKQRIGFTNSIGEQWITQKNFIYAEVPINTNEQTYTYNFSIGWYGLSTFCLSGGSLYGTIRQNQQVNTPSAAQPSTPPNLLQFPPVFIGVKGSQYYLLRNSSPYTISSITDNTYNIITFNYSLSTNMLSVDIYINGRNTGGIYTYKSQGEMFQSFSTPIFYFGICAANTIGHERYVTYSNPMYLIQDMYYQHVISGSTVYGNNIRIYNKVLTQNEIKNLSNSMIHMYPNGSIEAKEFIENDNLTLSFYPIGMTATKSITEFSNNIHFSATNPTLNSTSIIEI